MRGMSLAWMSQLMGACIAVGLIAACDSGTSTPTVTQPPVESPTPSPSPTSTSTPDPSPTPTDTPTPTPPGAANPDPTVESPPTPDPTANLTWTTPQSPVAWEAPLSFTNDDGRMGGALASLDEQIYVSWAVQNNGPRDVDSSFSTHLYLDGVFLNSWRGDRVDAGSYVFYDNWDGVEENVRLTPGEHALKLWIDPYNEVAETKENDNVLQITVTVTGEQAKHDETRLPDLVPQARAGWDAPLVLNSWGVQGTNGPVSVDARSYVSFAGRNVGVASALDGVSAHLYIDDVYVEAWMWGYVLTDDVFYLGSWDGLQSTMRLAPGEHVVRLVLDAGDFVDESDETNNTLARTYEWTTGPVGSQPTVTPPQEPSMPAPVTRPDLVPYWRFEGHPIVVSRSRNTRTEDPAVAGRTAYVDLTVHNQSRHETGPFAVELYLDGNLVRTLNSPSLLGSGVREFLDQPVTLNVPPGEHTLRMVMDSNSQVVEHNEADNVYEHVFTVHESPPPPPTPATYTDAEIDRVLARLPDALDDRRPVLGPGSSGLDSYAREVADVGYYLMTGTRIQDEDLRIFVLSKEDYRDWIDENYADDFATAREDDLDDLLARREHLKSVNPAFKTRDKGAVTIVVNAGHSFTYVLSSLAHELGHAKQDIDRPEQTVGSSSFELNALQEAQAQQFERAFWLTVESRLDDPILSFPEHPAYEAYVTSLFDGRLADYLYEEHALGYFVQWLAVLTDPELAGLKLEMTTHGGLSAEGSLKLFEHLAEIDPSNAQAYVNGLLDHLGDWLPIILDTAHARTVEGLPAGEEGPPDLRSVALGSP